MKATKFSLPCPSAGIEPSPSTAKTQHHNNLYCRDLIVSQNFEWVKNWIEFQKLDDRLKNGWWVEKLDDGLKNWIVDRKIGW